MASPKMPRAMRATTGDIGQGRYPKALLVSCLSWVLLGIVMVLSRVGSPSSTDEQETNAATGVTAVRAPDADQGSWTSFLPLLGVVILVFAAVLFMRQGWARLILALLGMLSVVALAATASWLAVPAAVLFVVGGVTGVLVSTHRYLMRPRPGDQADPETTRAVS